MAAKLLSHFKQRVESMELQPSKGGCFELSLDGKLAYSKLDTGQFPDEDDMLLLVEQKLRG